MQPFWGETKIYTKRYECVKFHGSRTVVGFVGLVLLCHLAFVVISWVQKFFSWISRGSKIFSRGYFMGPKSFPVGISWVQNFFWWIFRGFKIFLVGNYVILREKIYRIKSHETNDIEMHLKLCIIFQIDLNSYKFYLY